ncbi:MAG TPA: GNAT family N-acetyltransferase [Armatimonadota bacterium]|jgi:CelD/BcsL family acetyltransferase involved in cellulose biosynthesis
MGEAFESTQLAEVTCTLLCWDADASRRIRAAWEQLLAANPHASLFARPEWLAMAREVGIVADCHVLLIARGDTPIGLLPLQRRSRWVWEVAAPFAMDSSSFLLDARDGRDAWRAVAHWLRHQRRIAALFLGMCTEQECLAALSEACRAEGTGLRIDTHPPTTWITLAPTWDAYLSTLDKRIRRNLRYAEAQFQRGFPRASVEIIDTVEGSEDALTALIRLYRSRWADQAGGTIFDQPGHTEFFLRAMRWALSRGYALLFVLQQENRILTGLCFLHVPGQTYAQAFYIGRDPQAVPAKYSPGVLVMNAAIRWCIERGLTHLQTGSGNYQYKHWLKSEDFPLWQLTLTRSRLSGTLVLGLERGGYLLRRFPLHAAYQARRLVGRLLSSPQWVLKRIRRVQDASNGNDQGD